MVKSLLTGAELRHAAKERIKRHREVMERKGYKTTSIFMSESIRAELKRLGDDMGLTRHDALDHIFRGYLASLDTSAPITPDNDPGLTADELPDAKECLEIQRDLFTGEAVVDTTEELDIDIEDADTAESEKIMRDPGVVLGLASIENQKVSGKDLLLIAEDLPHMTTQELSDMLNGYGATTGRGAAWTAKKVRDLLYIARKNK